MTNRLFVAYKPVNISSNHFLTSLKRKYKVKKAGFSGTLDPFAKGSLIIGFGQYTKLFRFLEKSKKRYRATLWLGASSPTLDTEQVKKVQEIMPFASDSLDIIAKQMVGTFTYAPPKFSAKKVDGKRAYDLARSDKSFDLEPITSTVYDFSIVSYMHPFLTFDLTISEGGYVRSIGSMIAKKFGFDGVLSSLERISEGMFVYENEKALDPYESVKMQENRYLGDISDIEFGKVLSKVDFEKTENGMYKLRYDYAFSIIEITDSEVKYLLNKVPIC